MLLCCYGDGVPNYYSQSPSYWPISPLRTMASPWHGEGHYINVRQKYVEEIGIYILKKIALSSLSGQRFSNFLMQSPPKCD